MLFIMLSNIPDINYASVRACLKKWMDDKSISDSSDAAQEQDGRRKFRKRKGDGDIAPKTTKRSKLKMFGDEALDIDDYSDETDGDGDESSDNDHSGSDRDSRGKLYNSLSTC